MAAAISDARARAQAHFDADEFDPALSVALDGLSSAGDDVELLLLAGRAGVEVDSPDAVGHLQRATELAPGDARTWHHLGEALAADGRTEEAHSAFRQAVELDPDDQVALSHLGHTALVAGRDEEGVEYLVRAASTVHGASTASISLVDMYRSFGQYADALAQAQRLADAVPDDALAWLDVAELNLSLHKLDDARNAFGRLREIDDVPGHEAYPLHGLLQVEIEAEQWDRARALAAQAAAIDPHGLSTEVAAFLQAQAGEEPAEGQSPPARHEVEAALVASLRDYRAMLSDDRRLNSGEIIG
ncbi:MAG: tetratricopeptide repeat protein [Solirubrobacteraceae bacterium]|jgi:tetratricopeptide (TPR) repeat protein